MQLKKRNTIPESIALALIVGGITLIPGVEKAYPSSYSLILVTALFLSFWNGRAAGLLSFLAAQSVHTGGLILTRNILPLPEEFLIQNTAGFLICFFGGSLNLFRLYQIDKIMTRYRRLSDEKCKLKEITDSQHDIIRELEERVTRQRTSLNLLYDRIQEVDCLDSRKSISNLLDTIIHFSEATRISLWVYDNQKNCLKLKMRKGQDNSGGSETDCLDLKKTIEGWVFRNNQMFSIRMAMDYDTLAALNTEDCIICCPVLLDNKTWGVVNLEALPFIKYSGYTENLVQIIISLAQPALKRALNFETLLVEDETNTVTGLPQFTQLYRELERYKYDESGTLNSSSLVLMEFQDYRELVDRFGLQEIRKLQGRLLKELSGRSQSNPEMFHYREESIMALYFPYLDYDGCSLFCLESLEYINQQQLIIKGETLEVEINLGYASSGTGEKMDPDDLMKRAEYLLEIQKI